MSEPKAGHRRISIDVPEDIYIKFTSLVPWGDRGKIHRLMISDFVDVMEEHGPGKVIGAFIERAVTMKDLMKVKLEEK